MWIRSAISNLIRVLLNCEGWKVGKDLVYRLYKEEGLGLRERPKRDKSKDPKYHERNLPSRDAVRVG
jgi:hypothetical protein